MNNEYRAYRRVFRFLQTVLFPFYRIRCVGGSNVPKGPALLCANHSSNLDPILLSMAVGIEIHPHYMAKMELFRLPVVAGALRAIGTIPVDRGNRDIAAIKSAMKYLKVGEKVGIFPEGHRFTSEEGGAAKRGAVQIADQMTAPIVPVFIPRNKKAFHTYTIVIGMPYLVNPEKKKLTHDEFERLSSELMNKINELGREQPS